MAHHRAGGIRVQPVQPGRGEEVAQLVPRTRSAPLPPSLEGHFFGVALNAGQANLGGVKLPFRIWKSLADRRYEAKFAGGGLTYGYVWSLGDHWGMEASVGLGYEYVDYREYACPTCGERTRDKTKHYIGPQKVALSVVYEF